ncbi:short-chain dehydrogenase [Irpex rosettiformis]|uniref:Short-chain dehydrogenase n=1 Tax=Irpex rosettiformis TaxID=378272 RepID=A0ACB8UG75_9APHY|nr:short-chain dehydrogenase [Irpex rosettiformis]
MVRHGFLPFVIAQYTPIDPVLTTDLSGKSVIVTGANTGLGLEAAKHFARMGPARLILACRSEARGKVAAEELAIETSYNAEVQLLDLSSFDSVKSFAKRLEGEPIDIYVANAAVALMEYVSTQDGWEQCVQVNHLSTALLSFLLLPNLVKASSLHGSSSRVVIVSSGAAFASSFDGELAKGNVLAKLSDQEHSTSEMMAHRYADTKLLNIFFARAFAHHLSPSFASSIIPNSVNPGLCITDLSRNVPLLFRIRLKMLHFLLGHTAEQGSRQLVWAALGPDGQEGPHVKPLMSGAYVALAQVKQPSDFVTSKAGWELQENIWNETIDILSKIEPSVRSIISQYLD